MRQRSTVISPNQGQISRVDEDPHGLSENEYGIPQVNSINEQDDGAADAEQPELHWYDALALTLARDPLQQKPGGEARLPHQT